MSLWLPAALACGSEPLAARPRAETVPTGSISVRASNATLGSFSVALGYGLSASTTTGGPVVFPAIPPGTYALYVFTEQCRVLGGNPRAVTVRAFERTDVSFDAECATGRIVVTMAASGSPPPYLQVYVTEADDPWCYNYQCQTLQAPTSGSALFERRYKVPHSIWILDLPRDCSATPTNYEGVVPDSIVAFAINCR